MNQLRCNPYRVLSGVLGMVIIFTTFPMLFSPGTDADQRQLSRLVQKMKVMQAECEDVELAELLGYTSQTYNTISRFNVRILSLNCINAAGMNWPVVPGMTLDREIWGNSSDRTLIGLMLHEAMHDYYPCFGHGHMEHLVPVGTNNKYDELCYELN